LRTSTEQELQTREGQNVSLNTILWTTLQAFLIAVVLTPIFRDMFRSFNVVDEPDANRKVHVYPIPRVGGMAIAVGYGVSVYLNLGSELLSNELLISGLLPAAALVFFTGLVDDFFGLKPWQKILGQFAAASVAFWAGVRITGVAGHALADVWSAPLTIGWLLLCTNAVNLVDGLDGLAAGVGLFATLTMFAAAMISGNEPLAYATLPLAGCLLGFLCFNFNPATVFLGDCGSLLIGFLLGCFGIIWTQKSATLFGITAPLMALSMPLLDVGLCIVRRWLRNQPIFSADRGHIHHKLLDRGLSPRQAVLLLYAFCGAVAILSLVQSFINHLGIALGRSCVRGTRMGRHPFPQLQRVRARAPAAPHWRTETWRPQPASVVAL
jgi:UDP-GlcNAc:undecaprenyl-phosphate GlcNAc-1-phosphate transferase